MRTSVKAVAVASVVAAMVTCAGERTSALANPERGFRFELIIGLEDDEPQPRHIRDNWPFAVWRDDGISVAQAYCYLTRYCDAPIPQRKLDALQRSFDRARADGVKFLLRFAYERDMTRTNGPSLSRILSHVVELTPIVRRNADVIYALQTGWVGAWGEFHSSASGVEYDKEASAKIVKATLDMLPENRMTMMRTMQQREDAIAVLDGGGERIGLFNDATLANFHDAGTFMGDRNALMKMAWDEILGRRYSVPGNPQFDELCRVGTHVPVDGELFWNGHVDLAQQTGLAAILRFYRHHYTTFSLVHGHSKLDKKPEFGAMDAWKVTPVTKELLMTYGVPCDDAYFAGVPHRTAFEYIRDHLGYRIVAKSCEVRGGRARVTLHNFGFAAPINPRKAYFAVVPASNAVKTCKTDFDCRALSPGADVVIEGCVPSLEPGDRLALWLPDESPSIQMRCEYAISLAGGVEVLDICGRRLNVITCLPADR